MPLKTSLVAALAGPLLLCAPAMAQTAAEAPLAANSTAALDAQIASYLDASPDAGPVKTAPALRGSDAPPPPDRAVHGEVGVGIGTGGYREFHAAMVAPLGSTGTVAIAIGQVRGRGFRGPVDPGLLPGPDGLGDGAPRGYGARLAPACDPARDKTATQPLWVTRMRANEPAAPAADCPAARP